MQTDLGNVTLTPYLHSLRIGALRGPPESRLGQGSDFRYQVSVQGISMCSRQDVNLVTWAVNLSPAFIKEYFRR